MNLDKIIIDHAGKILLSAAEREIAAARQQAARRDPLCWDIFNTGITLDLRKTECRALDLLEKAIQAAKKARKKTNKTP